jgi:hypothetical protein
VAYVFILSTLLQVSPDLYGDNNTRLFTYWTSDAYQATGCYNLLCSGFIQINNQIAMGASISPLSNYGGSQYDINILVWKVKYKKPSHACVYTQTKFMNGASESMPTCFLFFPEAPPGLKVKATTVALACFVDAFTVVPHTRTVFMHANANTNDLSFKQIFTGIFS